MVMTSAAPLWATRSACPEPGGPVEFERPIATVTCSGGREAMVILLVQRESGEPEIYVDGRSFSQAEAAMLVGGVQMARDLAARSQSDSDRDCVPLSKL
jgi:hypothetical protein